jgi:hypothetical protein
LFRYKVEETLKDNVETVVPSPLEIHLFRFFSSSTPFKPSSPHLSAPHLDEKRDAADK